MNPDPPKSNHAIIKQHVAFEELMARVPELPHKKKKFVPTPIDPSLKPLDLTCSHVHDNDSFEEPMDVDQDFSNQSPEELAKTVQQLSEMLAIEESKLILMKKIKASQECVVPVSRKPIVNPDTEEPASSVVHPGLLPPLKSGPLNLSKPKNGIVPPASTIPAKTNSGSVKPEVPSSTTEKPSTSQPVVSAKQPPQSQYTANALISDAEFAQKQQLQRDTLKRQIENQFKAIPPPKATAPEINFVPALSGAVEFVNLLGLEEVVQFMVDFPKGIKREEEPIYKPFVCSQCSVSFTPIWKREKPGSRNVICDECVSTNQKKMLAEEHTPLLKEAFAKATEQEKELDDQLKKDAESRRQERRQLLAERSKAQQIHDANKQAQLEAQRQNQAAAQQRQRERQQQQQNARNSNNQRQNTSQQSSNNANSQQQQNLSNISTTSATAASLMAQEYLRHINLNSVPNLGNLGSYLDLFSNNAGSFSGGSNASTNESHEMLLRLFNDMTKKNNNPGSSN